MRFFFRSKQFKTVLSIFLVLVLIAVLSFAIGDRIAPQSDILGTIAAPFRAAFTEISGSISDFSNAYTKGDKAMLENAELKNEIDRLNAQLAELEELKNQNEFYKDYLDIKDNNPDFIFTDAKVIAVDSQDPFKGFVINRGSADGISRNDPIITDAGLVGYVTEVGITTSKAATILSPEITLGAIDNRTSDSGIVSGTLAFAESGYTRIYNLSRSCTVSLGDIIVTSGEGIFPNGLLIGTVESVESDKYNTSIFAAVKPFVDFGNLKSVMVITEFEGQGHILEGSED
jgi:rod shape-determining protein MreC